MRGGMESNGHDCVFASAGAPTAKLRFLLICFAHIFGVTPPIKTVLYQQQCYAQYVDVNKHRYTREECKHLAASLEI